MLENKLDWLIDVIRQEQIKESPNMALINQLLDESHALTAAIEVKNLTFLQQEKWLTVMNLLEIE